jgi:hypothetical protein
MGVDSGEYNKDESGSEVPLHRLQTARNETSPSRGPHPESYPISEKRPISHGRLASLGDTHHLLQRAPIATQGHEARLSRGSPERLFARRSSAKTHITCRATPCLDRGSTSLTALVPPASLRHALDEPRPARNLARALLE